MEWEQVIIYKSDSVDSQMTERGIKDEDVKKVIVQAEKTGQKLCREYNTIILAKARLGKYSVYAEYSPQKDGFEVISAYSHRVSIKSDSGELR